MKSFVANGSDPSKNEKFLAYMVPSPDEVFFSSLQTHCFLLLFTFGIKRDSNLAYMLTAVEGSN